MDQFFPHPWFGWVFLLSLLSTLVWASYHDLRKLVVPKRVPLVMLGLALLLNLIRGSWLGSLNSKVWLFSNPGIFLGLIDGLLFFVAGFFLGFALFFALWILGTCGGGDVKLFAALGAWIGPGLTLWILAAAVVVVIFIVIGRLLVEFVISGLKPGSLAGFFKAEANKTDSGEGPNRRRRVLGFALPLTLACVTTLPPLLAQDLDTGWLRIETRSVRRAP